MFFLGGRWKRTKVIRRQGERCSGKDEVINDWEHGGGTDQVRELERWKSGPPARHPPGALA